MENVIDHITSQLPGVQIISGTSLFWSPKNKTITYRKDRHQETDIWGLYHEAGHAKLGHTKYTSDVELLQMEVAAWDIAVDMATGTNHVIDYEYIQDCLDTYRDWLHQRSTCPRCGIVSFETQTGHYDCFNCNKTWSVSTSRLCRPYRLGTTTQKDRSEPVVQAVFQ